jgi:hypothetical protein
MATKKDTGGEATSPAIEAIDPRQAAAAGLTSTPVEADARTGTRPDPKDDPNGPGDVSNVVDPSDPMTLTGKDAQPGESGR